jgi:hypothetical protein
MRYPDGGGLDAGERARREQVRPGWTSGRGAGGALAAVVICWLVSVAGCVPAAVILGIWLSGWKDPGPGIIQGASKNPLYSGAGPAMLLSFVVLFVLATVFWSWVFGRLACRRRD